MPRPAPTSSTTEPTGDAAPVLTPRLRFPEFRAEEGWARTTIGTISPSVVAGGTPSTSEESYWGGPIRWMNSGELNLKRVYEVAGRITEEGLRNSSTQLIPPGCTLIGLAGQGKTRGTVAMNFVELCTNQSIAAIHPDEAVFVAEFLYHNLDSRYEELRRLSANGEGRGGLNLQIIRALEVFLPSRPEQQKIADCLTSLGEVIAAQGRKVEALKAHKKGLMRHVFPQEGQTLPRLRFPEFRGAGRWAPRSMSYLLDRVAKAVDVQDADVYREIGIRSHGKGLFHKDPIKGNAIGTKRVFWVVPSAFVLNIIFAWEQAVATTTEAEEGFIASHRFPMYLGKADRCDVRFLKDAFLTPRGKYLLGLASPGGAGRNRTLGQQEFEKIQMVVPDTAAEQSRIADLVAAAETLIRAETEKLDTLRAHKAGLMQQLFPSR